MAKMAGGHADDLATAVLLATDKPILLAPAMNPHMWAAKATQRNLAQLATDGVRIVGPNSGEMAERGEAGVGRMAEPLEIVAAVEAILRGDGPLAGKRVLVTSGPTSEPIDPVRFIANRSSGKQGHAIAAAAAAAGAEVVLVSGPVNVPDPPGVSVVQVETAQQMLAAVEKALPADVAVFAAAVADWRPRQVSAEQDQEAGGAGRRRSSSWRIPTSSPRSRIASPAGRSLVIGFAAETDNVLANAQAKLAQERLRLDRRQRRFAGDRHHGRRRQHGSPRHRGRRRSLATAVEGECRAHAGRAHRRHAEGERSGEHSRCASSRLPHAADLPLPQYQSAHAAGLDLLAAVPADAPIELAPGGTRHDSDRHRHRAARRHRGPGAAALRSGARHGVTVLNAPARRCRLSRRIQVILVNLGAEPFVVTRHAHRAAGVAPFAGELAESPALTQRARNGGFGSTGPERAITV